MYRYSALLTPDPEAGGFVVTFPDVPEAITEGDTLDEALTHASEALEAALSLYVESRKALPRISKRKGRRLHPIALSATTEAKLALYEAMQKAGIRKATLARQLGWQKSLMDRLLDLNHHSRIEQLEQALAALGKRLSITVE